jgi:hypothetical protein
MDDLGRLREWVKTAPECPDGDWYKDFGSFVLCGAGEFPKPFYQEACSRSDRISNSCMGDFTSPTRRVSARLPNHIHRKFSQRLISNQPDSFALRCPNTGVGGTDQHNRRHADRRCKV